MGWLQMLSASFLLFPQLLNGNETFLFEHLAFLAVVLKKMPAHCLRSWLCKQIGHRTGSQRLQLSPQPYFKLGITCRRTLYLSFPCQIFGLQVLWLKVTPPYIFGQHQPWQNSAFRWVQPQQSHRQGTRIMNVIITVHKGFSAEDTKN